MRHPSIAMLAALLAAAGCEKDEATSPVAEAKADSPPAPAPEKPAPAKPAPAAEPSAAAPAPAPAPGGDPHGGRFTLAEALAGLPDKGTLTATIATSMGTFTCDLYEKEAPITLANFVGLARGLRAWKDPKTGEWVKRPLYDGLTFHRVIPGFMIQGGDPEGTGRGGPGYAIEEEFHPSRRHDRPGILSMAKKPMPRTTGSQFFVTDGPTPHLDDRHSVFGHCEPAALVSKIAGVPKADGPGGSRPAEPVTIDKVTITRR